MTSRFEETLEYLYTRLPMFSRQGAAAIKPDLTNTLALCELLDNPQRRFKSIHIAGTNGKGSTSHMLAAIFQQAGYKTGLYTSPHLADFRERIRIGGKMVAKDFVVDFVARHRAAIERIEPSFFEITVAMAFQAFAEAEVDIAIIETGLGGRLDSTNVIVPELSVITNISLDHTELLGKTIPEIAREKAGIIKPGVPVVIGERGEEAMPVFRAVADANRANLHEAYKRWHVTPAAQEGYAATNLQTGITEYLPSDLKGSFQQSNIATVLSAADLMNQNGWKLPRGVVKNALTQVKNLTGLRGRWDVWQTAPTVIADVAHNPAGLAVVMSDWAHIVARQKHIVLGFVRDKNVREALHAFPEDAKFHFCAAGIPRALPVDELAAIAAEAGLYGKSYTSVANAFKGANQQLGQADALLITGSFFVVGEAMLEAGINAA